VVFVDKELSEIAKVLKDFQKEQDKFQFGVAIMDNVVYSQKDVQRIAELPPKEVLLSQVMSLINGPATGTAIAINQVMASLARGIKLVAQQNA
jgi:large subunit ribosomal protein L10